MSQEEIAHKHVIARFLRSWPRWFITVVASFFLAILPYWIFNWLHISDITWPWWRVPVATSGVFDSYVYFNWMGAIANDFPAGDLVKWYAFIIKGAWALMSSWASIPEIWIVTRWLSLVLALGIGAWCIRRWSDLDRKTSWMLIVPFWFAIGLSIGLRPGAYSWYLPFGLFSMVASASVLTSLRSSRYVSAGAWSVAALFSSLIYPWYMMFVGLWMASMWGVHLVQVRPRVYHGFLAACAVTVCCIAIPVASWFLDPARASMLGMYERSGIVFARVPFFANTVLAFGAWIVLFGLLAYVYRHRPRIGWLMRDLWAWIVLACLWFNTPITGIHLYSDHFIAVTVLLAWYSLATVWSTMREAPPEEQWSLLPKTVRFIPTIIAVCSTLFLLYIVQQPLRFNVAKFDSYAVHVIHWLALSVAAWICTFRLSKRNVFLEKVTIQIVIIVCFIIGVWGMTSMIIRDDDDFSLAISKVPVSEWIHDNVLANETLCADVGSASFFSAHSGRVVYPAEGTLSYAVSNEEVFRMLETIAGAYDVVSSGDLAMYRFYTDHYRTIPCAAASQYSHNAWWYKMLLRFGVTESSVNDLIGCRQSVIDANWARMSSAIERNAIDVPEFEKRCSYVIIPDSKKQYWQLPNSYREVWFANGVGIWKSRER